jgi:hypothetical protein
MPLVLTQNDATVEGHDYRDVLGVSYEYPTRYRSLIRSGERFVYYRGRRTSVGPDQPQAYFGAGIIGTITPAPNGRLRCSIEDYRPFSEPLPFRHGEDYYEKRAAGRGSQTGLHFRQGARALTEAEYSAIIRDAGDTTDGTISDEDYPGYASARTAAAVEAVSVALAVEEAGRRFRGAEVQPMPHANPGYDILIGLDGDVRYIEVKGTLGQRARFFMSEGERRFSEANGDRYSLWVYCEVDLDARTGRLVERSGELSRTDVLLAPHQWRGEIP